MIPKQLTLREIEDQEIAAGTRCCLCREPVAKHPRGKGCPPPPQSESAFSKLSQKYSEQIAAGTFSGKAAAVELTKVK